MNYTLIFMAMTGHENVMEATIWSDAERIPLVGRVLERMGGAVRIICIGGPRSSEVDQFARQMECPIQDDLRKMVIDHPAAFVVVATTQDTTPDDAALALRQGATIIAFEPIAASFDELVAIAAATGSGFSPGFIEPAASFLRGTGWTRAAEPTEVLGAPRLIRFASTGPCAERSLFARLHEAWQVVLRLRSIPETIDASLVGPLTEVPQDVRALGGHLVAHARLPGGAAAAIVVSDAIGGRERSLHMIGDDAAVRVDDFEYELSDMSGRPLDSYRCDTCSPDFADLVADDWSRLIDRGPTVAPDEPGPDQVLACCLACQLSARTSEPESPATFLKMRGRG